ncbi:hypothetical protein L6R52_11500 [Myxococcota bacterium]|nr:hypothetical protein [Myxococcota bacterium]
MTFDDLVLVGLLGRAPKAGVTEAELSKRLGALAQGECADAISPALDAALSRLEDQGFVVRDGTNRWEPRSEGRVRACEQLRVPSVERSIDWRRLADIHLSARALDYPRTASRAERLRLGDVQYLRTEIVRAHFELAIDRAPSEAALRAALGWVLLPRGAPRELVERAVRLGTFASKVLVTDVLMFAAAGRAPVVRGKGLVALAAMLAGASDDSAAALRRAVLRRLWPELRTAVPPPSFVDGVLAAARASREGWFDDERVFISHVWRRLPRHGIELSIEALKARLLEEHRAGRIVLGRAELPHIMNAIDLRESRIEDRNAAYVFIKVPGAEPARR